MSISTPINSTNQPFPTPCGTSDTYKKYYQEVAWPCSAPMEAVQDNCWPYGPVATWPLWYYNFTSATKICKFITVGLDGEALPARVVTVTISINGVAVISNFDVNVPAAPSIGTSRVARGDLPSTLTINPGDYVTMVAALDVGGTGIEGYIVLHLEWDGQYL